MATINQIEFIQKVKDKIREPILIFGAKNYDYDAYSIGSTLKKLNYSEIVGVDICNGEGVDVVADACDLTNSYFNEKKSYFNTVFCMELLTHVQFPWLVGKNINKLTKKGGHVIISECFVRKMTRMPKDYWRFTYDSFPIIFDEFEFIDELAMKSLTRSKTPDLLPLNNSIFEIMHEKADGETTLGYIFRKVHRKFGGGKLFNVSRILPEQTFYAVGKKIK